jgi:ferredoxin--NADP+ reductase
MAGDAYNATVISRVDINPLLRVIRLQPDGPLFDFIAGQFGVLGMLGSAPSVVAPDPNAPADAGRMIRRAYSIASSSLERDYSEFYITLVTSGQLTPRLFALDRGGRIFLGPKPTGVFTLARVPPEKAVIFIATGTGIAPYMSMLRTSLVDDDRRTYVLLHGVRYSWDLGYRAELESLARIRRNLIYLPSITRPDEDPYFHGITGRIQTLVEGGLIQARSGVPFDPDVADVFLCGHPDMIADVTTFLQARRFTLERGKAAGTIHIEEYW